MPPPSAKVEILEQTTTYRGPHLRVDRYRLRHTRYAGGWGREIHREVMDRGHAVAVLPYDPEADAVVLIEQFRVGAYLRGDENSPWLLEIIAGLFDADEAPEEVARREALEEAGLELGEMVAVANFFATPGAVTEHLHIFCARVDSRGAGGIHGLDEEGEDIQVLAMPFAEAMELLSAGRIQTSPALVALQWLALNRDDLRARWG